MEDRLKKSEIKKGASEGILTGIIASLCCLLPLLIILFGLGTISSALKISQYRSFFLGGGTLSLILAIILYLKRKSKFCNVNCLSFEGIKREKHFIISIILAMGITYLLLIYILVPKIFPIIFKNFAQKPEVLVQSEKLRVLTLKIEGMNCEGCAEAIKQYLLTQLQGIKEARIDYLQGKGEIIYNSAKITKEELLDNEIFKTYKSFILSDKSFE